MVRKRWATVSLGTAILLVLGASMVAAGVVVTGQGNSLAVIKTVSKVSSQTTSSTSWVNLNGAVRKATATSSGTLFVAEFTSETSCREIQNKQIGPSGGIGEGDHCVARIIVKDTSGSTIGIMNPVDGEEANFDSPVFGSTPCGSPNGAECVEPTGFTVHGHAMNRSITLGAGTYDFQVQFRTGCSCLEFTLDDWHLTLTRYNP